MRIFLEDPPRRQHRRYRDDDCPSLTVEEFEKFLEEWKKKSQDKKKEHAQVPPMSFGTALLVLSIAGPCLFFGTAYTGAYTIVSIIHMFQGVLH